ncbi:hypothetical protein BsWGS_14723 [Bradybaena similaris]
MATTYLLRVVSNSTRLISAVVRKEACYVHRCLPCVSVTHSFVVSRAYSSFTTKVTANELWEGITSVSNPGRKRGRGRNMKRKVNLNRFQVIGKGKSGFVFPGLEGPALVGAKPVSIHKSAAREEEVIAPPPMRRRFPRIPALQRGYSGRKYPGTSLGAPDPINDYVFEGFDTRVLQYKMVSHMTGNLGRKMSISTLVVTGNGKGLAGYAVASAPQGKTALRKAKNKAAQRLQYFERYNDHTVYHDFAVKEHKTSVFVKRVQKGHGLKCHRVIKTLCQIIGIEDILVKEEGRVKNTLKLTQAFFKGLAEQETHQQLADRIKLNVVEYRPELENLPIPVAKPREGYSRPNPIDEEEFDFDNMYYKDGKIPLKKEVDPLAFHKSNPKAWKHYLMKDKYRNQPEAKYLRILYGLQPSLEEIKIRQKPLK